MAEHDGAAGTPGDRAAEPPAERLAGAPAEAPAGGAEPHFGFADSRRLTGPSRCCAGSAVTLTPLGPAAHDAATHARWAARVQQACAALGWSDPQPRVLASALEPALMFAAPPDQLFTATEVNEWAWERSAAEAAADAAADAAPDAAAEPASASTPAPTFDLAQPALADPHALFAPRAAAEARPALAALRHAAAVHALPLLADDEAVSIGAGTGSRCWPLAALPAPADVPWPQLHDVPTALVSGSNGKTTTVRLLAAIAQQAGHTSGHCCTEGVFVAGQRVEAGDYSGPAGARAVLRHPAVALAVLETARGGILRRGLAVARADVAVVTNIQPDHLGEYGIASADDLAEVKLTLARALPPGATLVLNADDAVLMAAAARLPHAAAARQALFAADADHPLLDASKASAAAASSCGVRAGHLWLRLGSVQHDLGAVAQLPMTLGGAARHNIANAAAAALAAAALGLPVAAIAATLAHFGADPNDNAGRLERWSHRGATVLIDYAHNPDGLAQLLHAARALAPRRLGLLLGQAGNRDDAAIVELARCAARFAPDEVLVKELPQMLRGRAAGEVPALLRQALQAAGVGSAFEADEETAARRLLAWARPGDVVVLPVHTAAVREALARLLAAS